MSDISSILLAGCLEEMLDIMAKKLNKVESTFNKSLTEISSETYRAKNPNTISADAVNWCTRKHLLILWLTERS